MILNKLQELGLVSWRSVSLNSDTCLILYKEKEESCEHVFVCVEDSGNTPGLIEEVVHNLNTNFAL